VRDTAGRVRTLRARQSGPLQINTAKVAAHSHTRHTVHHSYLFPGPARCWPSVRTRLERGAATTILQSPHHHQLTGTLLYPSFDDADPPPPPPPRPALHTTVF